MSYYVECNLELENANEEEMILIAEYIEVNQDNFYGIYPNGDHRYEGSWRDRRESFDILSKKFPNVLFKLYCIGEDNAIFLEYFKDGIFKKTSAIISYLKWEELD